MNFRVYNRYVECLRRLSYYCFLGATSTLAGKSAERYFAADPNFGPPPIEQQGPSHPYLTVVGPPPLRFQDAPPVSSLLEPRPKDKAITKGAPPGLVHAGSSGPPASLSPSGPRTKLSTPGQAPAANEDKAGSTGTPAEVVEPSIIPDEMRQRVRPEEFLPFFQLPGSGDPGPGKPANIPPSSATYRQE